MIQIKETQSMGKQSFVYVLVEPSTTWSGEGIEVKLCGVYLDEALANEALEKNNEKIYMGEILKIPIGEFNRYGFV